MRGKVKFYDSRKGFGYVTREDGGRDVHFGSAGLEQGYLPRTGHLVQFDIKTSPKGAEAINVRLTPPASRSRGRIKWFDSRKGYGFIGTEDESADVFLPESQIEGAY